MENTILLLDKNKKKVIMDGKKRTPNFSSSEVDILLELVEKYKSIVECKKTDKVSCETKLQTWKRIEEEFKSTCGFFRSYSVLKNKYENLKKTAKKNFAEEKRNVYKTGGGVQTTIATKTDEKIKSIVASEQMEGMMSIYDDDNITQPKSPNSK